MELELKNVGKSYRDTIAMEHLSYGLQTGVYGFLGLNGAGKTTTMKMLCTLLRPTEGKIFYNGRDIFALEENYRKILGYLPQEFGFYPEFTVGEYIKYMALLKGVSDFGKKEIQSLLERVGLSKAEHKKMKKLSGGMKRRAGIAQAILNNPEILILDEPTAGLDPNERIRFRNLISELAQDRLVLLSTHIVPDVEYIANEILFIKDGKISYSGTPYEVIRSLLGKVWTLSVQKSEISFYAQRYKLANIKSGENTVELRLIGEEKPNISAREESPVLEDAFLYIFGEKGDEDNVSI